MFGAVLATNDFIEDTLKPFLRHTGPALSPFNAWVLLKGLETLDLRVEQHCRNAEDVAGFLLRQDKIERVLYPGFGSHPQHDLAMAQMDAGGGLVTFENNRSAVTVATTELYGGHIEEGGQGSVTFDVFNQHGGSSNVSATINDHQQQAI